MYESTAADARRARILATLERESLTMEQIAHEVGVSVATVRHDLTRLGKAVEMVAGSHPHRYRRRRQAMGA